MTKKSRDRRKVARYRNNKARSSSEWIDNLIEAHKSKVEYHSIVKGYGNAGWECSNCHTLYSCEALARDCGCIYDYPTTEANRDPYWGTI